MHHTTNSHLKIQTTTISNVQAMVSLLITCQFFAVRAAPLQRSSFLLFTLSRHLFYSCFLHRLKSSFFPVRHTLLSGLLSMVSSNTIDVVCKIKHT